MRDQGWEVDVAVHSVMARWASIVGPEMAAPLQAGELRGHRADRPYRLHRLGDAAQDAGPDLVRRLNAELGEGTVTRVNVQGPQAPWRKGPRTVRGGRGPRDTYG